jgi:hypothetical protein
VTDLGALELALHRTQRLSCREDGLSCLKVVLASDVRLHGIAITGRTPLPDMFAARTVGGDVYRAKAECRGWQCFGDCLVGVAEPVSVRSPDE